MNQMEESTSNKYSRQVILEEIGDVGQSKIANAKILIVGAGGLGCPCIQTLAAAGVGHLGIIDGDTVSLSNLHRQILFSEKDIKCNKAKSAARKALSINPTLSVNHYDQFLNETLAREIFEKYDIIVDGTDNFETRYLTNDFAVINKKPLVSGAVHKYEGQVAVFNYKESPTYRCLFPNEESLGFGCIHTGVLGTTTSIIGNMMAMEVIKIILDHKSILAGKLLVYNSLTNQQLITSFEKDERQVSFAKTKYKLQTKID